jgi:hypothetical protein
MKYEALGLTVLFVTFAGSALAQTHISGTGKCGKPDTEQGIAVGDRAGHMLALTKRSCTWSVPFEMAGLKSTTYTVAAATDITGAKFQDRGYVVITMDNGDKAYVAVHGTGSVKGGGAIAAEGMWSYIGGTGKLKGLKGKGTYKGTGGPDSAEDQVEGEYSLPEATTTPK